ncbi:phospho-N-acetylmuramoyl-pentapeptide-transferase [Thermanaerosceptrum fracticalcis]|nr:phospho-N-acetylmuramoyl-pentapeptide-transferase [Thermanaerosceptrum fracticalcis]
MAGIIASATCLVSGPLLIPFLRRLKFGQHIRTDGPKGHLQKAGTPTMGGIMFFLSLTLGTLLVRGLTTEIAIMLLVTLGFGIIGFLDDFIKVVMKRPLGLKAREKLLGQIILAGLLAYAAMVNLGRGTEVLIPGTALSFSLSWLYIPFAIFVVVSASNAVNLTDGLDGLAAGVTLFSALAYLLITEAWGLVDLSVFSGALVGTCLGFLFFNIHPARVFMGDTGSLALGGAIGALAVVTKTELLLPLLGGIYVLETLSVIIQVISFRLTGKRVFRMSPLHHHFELSGWSEQSVVLVFWTGAALFASIAVAMVL